LRENNQSGLVLVKERNRATIIDKESVKERQDTLKMRHDEFTGKDIEKILKNCDTEEVKKDLFSEEELVTVLKGFK